MKIVKKTTYWWPCVIFCWFCLCHNQLCAQSNISVKNVDCGSFPVVLLKLETDIFLDTFSINIIEADSTSITPSVQSLNINADSERNVFILFESSYITHYKEWTDRAITYMTSAIEAFAQLSDTVTNLNIGHFGLTHMNQKTLHLMPGFDKYNTSGEPCPLSVVANQSRVQSNNVDLYKAIYETLDWIANNSNHSGNTKLIVMATGKAISESPIKATQCIEKAQNLEVAIHTIGIKSKDRYAYDNLKVLSDKTEGIFMAANNKKSVEEALKKGGGISAKHIYQVKYRSALKANGAVSSAVLLIGSNSVGFEVTTPKSNNNIFVYLILGLALIGVGITVWLIYSRKKKKLDKIGYYMKKKPDVTGVRGSCNEINLNETDLTTPNKAEPTFAINDNGTEPLKNNNKRVTRINMPPANLQITDNGNAFVFNIKHGNTTLGRNAECDIVVTNPTISGRHLIISYNGITCQVKNLSQSNGTIINGQKTEVSNVYVGDKIVLGEVSGIFN